MAGQKKVIDASIGVKWFTNEEGSMKARELLKQHIQGEVVLVVPDLFFYEVYNAIRYKKIQSEFLFRCITDLFSFQLECAQLSPLLASKASEIALGNNISFYDSVYLALAIQINSVCISSDKKILANGGVSVQQLS